MPAHSLRRTQWWHVLLTVNFNSPATQIQKARNPQSAEMKTLREASWLELQRKRILHMRPKMLIARRLRNLLVNTLEVPVECYSAVDKSAEPSIISNIIECFNTHWIALSHCPNRASWTCKLFLCFFCMGERRDGIIGYGAPRSKLYHMKTSVAATKLNQQPEPTQR